MRGHLFCTEYTFRQLKQPRVLGGCGLAELSMSTNTSAYAEQCGQSVRMQSRLDGRNRCNACRIIKEMRAACIQGILDIQA